MGKIITEEYYCDGCGQKAHDEKSWKDCEKKHKGKELVRLVIGDGDYQIKHFFGTRNHKDILFKLDKWIPIGTIEWKLGFFLGIEKEQYHLKFVYLGDTEITNLKQKQIRIMRLTSIELIKLPTNNL